MQQDKNHQATGFENPVLEIVGGPGDELVDHLRGQREAEGVWRPGVASFQVAAPDLFSETRRLDLLVLGLVHADRRAGKSSGTEFMLTAAHEGCQNMLSGRYDISCRSGHLILPFSAQIKIDQTAHTISLVDEE